MADAHTINICRKVFFSYGEQEQLWSPDKFIFFLIKFFKKISDFQNITIVCLEGLGKWLLEIERKTALNAFQICYLHFTCIFTPQG